MIGHVLRLVLIVEPCDGCLREVSTPLTFRILFLVDFSDQEDLVNRVQNGVGGSGNRRPGILGFTPDVSVAV